MKCLVSFSLWGNNPIYTIGAIKQLKLYNAWSEAGPHEWTCVFYVGNSVPREITDEILALGGLVVFMKDWPEDQTATFWRFAAFHTGFALNDAIFSRDCDSRLSEREKLAVSEFLTSGKAFHIIRDHPYHGVPILAGLFGARSEISGLMSSQLPIKPDSHFYMDVNRFWNQDHRTSNDFYQVDQMWLRFKLYDHVKYQALVHDCFFGFDMKRFRVYLPQRDRGDFIGKGFDENDNPRHPEHEELFDTWPNRTRDSFENV